MDGPALMRVCYDLARWQSPRWEKGSRYYVAELTQDLFSMWQLVQHWGRKHSRLGGQMHRPAGSYADALAQLAGVEKRRARRGYRETEH